METVQTALDIIKLNKIGKGCKITFVSNKIYIAYPIHKTINGQYHIEKNILEKLFPTCSIQCYKLQNKGGINIWLNN